LSAADWLSCIAFFRRDRSDIALTALTAVVQGALVGAGFRQVLLNVEVIGIFIAAMYSLLNGGSTTI